MFGLLVIVACNTTSPEDVKENDSLNAGRHIDSITTTSKSLADTAKVKDWLTDVIESYSNSEQPSEAIANLRQHLTDDYFSYKQDALNLEYDNGDAALTEDAFKKKWSHKYNTAKAGSGGFFISTQDNGRVKVTACKLLPGASQQTQVYRTTLTDIDAELQFERDIKVVEQDGKWLIDDVVEQQ